MFDYILNSNLLSFLSQIYQRNYTDFLSLFLAACSIQDFHSLSTHYKREESIYAENGTAAIYSLK